ncbi:MAG: hypothetical protein AB4372_00090 [Xenococcus sp. (in: cyanobacteria)]
MTVSSLQRLCLDTNIYIIGTQEPNSEEAKILNAIGYYGKEYTELSAEIILSSEIIDQIRRVGKYLWGKDKASLVLNFLFSRLNIYYVHPNGEWHRLSTELNLSRKIPTEDIEIFLTAKYGNADCFVSGNRQLIQAIAEFECLTPTDFVDKYLS